MRAAPRSRFDRDALTIAFLTLVAVVGCRRAPPERPSRSTIPLRVGVAQLSATNPLIGLRQLAGLLSVEGLGRPSEDGRMHPWLAESWTLEQGQRSLAVKLRANVTFHDGSPFDGPTAATLLPNSLRSLIGPVFSDIDSIKAAGRDLVEITFKHPAPFLLEALEATIQKPGPTRIGTGAYMASTNASELSANPQYYLGPPRIARITVSNYPSARAAWAEMLRDNLDMLYEAGVDSLDSLERSSKISTFLITRHYQYVVALNGEAPSLRSAEVRRALNFAIDRGAVVSGALKGHGVESSGPLSTRHWAFSPSAPRFAFDPRRAANLLAGESKHQSVRLTCLVAPDSVDERIALELKRQFASVGVDLVIEEASREEIVHRAETRTYEAIITEVISGPTLARTYNIWHSDTPINWGHFGNATIDRALDGARNAPSEADYREAIAGVQRAFVEDPPAIFLSWSVRGRAVSKRFEIPPVGAGRDILSNVHLWKPVNEAEENQN
jgi:ABC-type transport system substrate-binding protein